MQTAELQDSLAAAGEVVIHDDGVALVAAAVSSSAPSGSDLEEDYWIAVATFQAGTVTARDLIGDIRFLSLDTRTPSPDPVWVRELALHTAVEEIMTIAALSMGMDTVSVTSSVLQRRLEDHLLDMYYACVIQPHLEAGESDLEELYLQVKDTLIIPEKRVFRTVTARGFDQMAFMQRALEADEDIFTMTDSLTQDPTLLAPGESCLTDTMVWSDVPAPWDSILFEAELDETVFCSVSVDRVLAFQPVAITAARPAMFRESLDELQEIYRTMKEDQLLQGLVDSLASVYHIEIDRDFVNSYVNTGGANDLQN